MSTVSPVDGNIDPNAPISDDEFTQLLESEEFITTLAVVNLTILRMYDDTFRDLTSVETTAP